MNPKKVNHDRLTKFSLAFVLLLAATAARAAGLSQATTIMSSLESNLTTLIPVVATVALMIIGIFYAMRMIHKDAFVHWFVGILVVGSAAEITALVVGS